MAISELSEATIRAHAAPESFQRGWSYYKNGAVHDLAVPGHEADIAGQFAAIHEGRQGLIHRRQALRRKAHTFRRRCLQDAVHHDPLIRCRSALPHGGGPGKADAVLEFLAPSPQSLIG